MPKTSKVKRSSPIVRRSIVCSPKGAPISLGFSQRSRKEHEISPHPSSEESEDNMTGIANIELPQGYETDEGLVIHTEEGFNSPEIVRLPPTPRTPQFQEVREVLNRGVRASPRIRSVIKIKSPVKRLRIRTSGQNFAISSLRGLHPESRRKILEEYSDYNDTVPIPRADETFVADLNWKSRPDSIISTKALAKEEINKLWDQDDKHPGLAREEELRLKYHSASAIMAPLMSMGDIIASGGEVDGEDVLNVE